MWLQLVENLLVESHGNERQHLVQGPEQQLYGEKHADMKQDSNL